MCQPDVGDSLPNVMRAEWCDCEPSRPGQGDTRLKPTHPSSRTTSARIRWDEQKMARLTGTPVQPRLGEELGLGGGGSLGSLWAAQIFVDKAGKEISK